MIHYVITLLSIGGIYLLLAQALNLQFGFAGLPNFGIVGFFAIGSYASALLTANGNFPVYGAMLIAGLLAALMSFGLARIVLRLRTDYLAIVTLSFSEIVRILVIGEEQITNGPRGVSGIPGIPLLWSPGVNAVVLIIAVNVLVALATHLLVRSQFGRSIRAMRDDEAAFASISKSAVSYKLRVFGLGGFVMGVAGALYAHYFGYISPDQFLPLTTFYVWIAVILGGAGRLSGALIGTIVLTLFLEGSRFLRDVLPFISEVEMASVRIGAIGFALMVLASRRPQGIMGDFTSK